MFIKKVFSKTLLSVCFVSCVAANAAQTEVIEISGFAYSNPANYTLIQRDELLQAGATVADVLKKTNGLQIREVSGLGNQVDVSMRGSTSKQVQLYIDGQLINDSQFGGFDLNQIPTEHIQSIEISKNQALGTGSTPIGGVIRINTYDPNKALTRVSAGAGRFGFYQGSLLISNIIANQQITAGINYLTSDNDYTYPVPQPIDDPNNPRNEPLKNNQFEKLSVYINNSFNWSAHQFKLSFQFNQQDKNLPNYQSNLATNYSALKSNSRRFSVNDDWLLANGALNSINIESYFEDKNERFINRANSNTNQVFDYQTDKFAVNLTSFWIFDSLTITPYLKYNHQEFESNSIYNGESRPCNGGSGCDVKARQQQIHLGSRFDWMILPNTLTGYLLLNQLNESNDNQINQLVSETNQDVSDKTANKSYVTFETGLSYDLQNTWLSPLTISAQLSQGARTPNLFERFGDRGLLKGNEDLLAETSNSLSVSFAQAFNAFEWQTSLYQQDVENAIVAIYNARNVGSYENVSQADVYGLELQLQYDLSKALQLSASSHFIDSTTHSPTPAFNHKKLPGIYHEQYQLGMHYQISNSWSASFVSAYDAALYYSRTNLIETNQQNKKGNPADRWVSDLMLNWEKDNIHASLAIKNLFDESYQDLANRPAVGRSFQIKLSIEEI
ncbi:TonB-dependent receptor plug domain-containing protein [Catenovulum sediminis]|uniref:TonB-dependent receptor n=1 Tax=Catenovulum sediminis TaxID=1740262 RepID=A0ABV1RJ09_9ALTE|nr:TonB-dependent receptor [Catenovulum sediminis]